MKSYSRREIFPLVGVTLLGTSCISAIKEDNENPDVLRPKALKKGDTVGICATAGGIKTQQEVDDFKILLQGKGFIPKEGKNIRKRYGYFAADDKSRAEEFMEMITDDEVKAIFFVRGGWGCARVLEFLDFDLIKKNPKVIMGFSDITTLLNAISSKTGLITFHGPGGNASWNDRTYSYFEKMIMSAESITFHNKKEDAPVRTIKGGHATGGLYGGNLSVLSSLIGSDFLPDWKGKILFLEDVKEEPYRIDRMLTQLKLAGVFDQVSGIVLGQFRDCIAEEKDRSFTIDEVFDQHFGKLEKPVYCGAQFGHVVTKFILPVGITVKIDANNGHIHMLHHAVEK